jgi:hypothetical protein
MAQTLTPVCLCGVGDIKKLKLAVVKVTSDGGETSAIVDINQKETPSSGYGVGFTSKARDNQIGVGFSGQQGLALWGYTPTSNHTNPSNGYRVNPGTTGNEEAMTVHWATSTDMASVLAWFIGR